MLLFVCLEQSFLPPSFLQTSCKQRRKHYEDLHIGLTGGIRSAMLCRVNVLRFVRNNARI